ncbi:MAG: hypothetical protein K0R09_3278, partial [Clostridiales bacterium]|nr:hypothetical protein [Clostridiales bacterium]
MKDNGKKLQWLWILVLSIVAFIWMLPLIFMVSMSFRTAETAFEPVLF